MSQINIVSLTSICGTGKSRPERMESFMKFHSGKVSESKFRPLQVDMVGMVDRCESALLGEDQGLDYLGCGDDQGLDFLS